MEWHIFWIIGTVMFAGLAAANLGRAALAWRGRISGRTSTPPGQARRDLLLGIAFVLYTAMTLLRLVDDRSWLSLIPQTIALPITWIALRGVRSRDEAVTR